MNDDPACLDCLAMSRLAEFYVALSSFVILTRHIIAQGRHFHWVR